MSFFCCTFAVLYVFENMKTNSHILAIDTYLGEMRGMVRALEDNPAKEALMGLINEAMDELMQVNTELSNRSQQVEDLMGRVSALSKNIYEPVLSAQFVYPEEGDYNGVREYVESRREQDAIFNRYCAKHSRKDLCERLTDEFGWVVDVKSYGRNLQRH